MRKEFAPKECVSSRLYRLIYSVNVNLYCSIGAVESVMNELGRLR
jgi:hypothetical protein